MQSGKDTTGNYLQSNYQFKRFAFADALKDEVALLFPQINRKLMDTEKNKIIMINDSEITIRELLIKHGKMMRKKDPNYWVKKVFLAIKRHQYVHSPMQTKYVITDWRYENELSFLKQSFCQDKASEIVALRLHRWSSPPLCDISETGLDGFSFDHVLTNLECTQALHDRIDNFISQELSLTFEPLQTPIFTLFSKPDWVMSLQNYLINACTKTDVDPCSLESTLDAKEHLKIFLNQRTERTERSRHVHVPYSNKIDCAKGTIVVSDDYNYLHQAENCGYKWFILDKPWNRNLLCQKWKRISSTVELSCCTVEK